MAAADQTAGIRRNSQPVSPGVERRGLLSDSRQSTGALAVVVCTGLQAGGHDTAAGILLSVLVMSLFVMAERIGSLLDEPMTDDDFGLPLDRFCASLTTDLLGPEHNLSRI
jgi:putative membrane protein